MSIYEILASAAFGVLFTRVYLSYKMDRERGSKSFAFKFLFGAYAFDAVCPVLRRAASAKEIRLKKLSNGLFITFWALFFLLMVSIWAKYR